MKIEVRLIPPERRRTGCLTWMVFIALVIGGLIWYGATQAEKLKKTGADPAQSGR